MRDKVDVLIIGSGASGAAVAWSLAETRMKILCLEQGDWMKQSDYPTNRRDYEARVFSDYATSPNIRQRPSDYPINDDNSPIKVVNFNAVGGSTVMYTAHYPRLHPSDFRVRTLDDVADDWPIDYSTLEPFFAENDRMTGVSGLAGDPAYPAHAPPMPPLPLGRSGAKIAQTMNRLGWHWWPSDSAIATVEYDGRAPCINLGHCTPACAQGAKASTDITYWPHAIRAGVELRTNCRVREITTGEDGMATGVVYYDIDGVEQFQPAEVVIMACNGVGTPRLLFNSASGRFPNGLANSSGLLGKNLMFHPWALVNGYVDEPMDGHRGPPLCLWSQEFYETDRSRGFLRGFNFQFNRTIGIGTEAVNTEAIGLVPWGEGHHDAFRGLVGHRMMVGICTEDLPEAHNRVTLDPVAQGPPRHPRTEGRLRDRREHQPHARLRDRPRQGNSRRRRSAGCPRRPPDRLWRLAPARHCPHGQRSRALGGERLGTQPRREEPVHRGRQHLRHLGRREPDLHDPGAGAVCRRQHQAALGNPVRLRPR